MTSPEVEAAIDVVARQMLACLVYDADEWENFPDIGEHDWQRVVARALAFASFPDRAEFDAAYTLLTARAEH